MRNWFQAFAFKWVNLYRYAEGFMKRRFADALREKGGAVHVEFRLPIA